MATKKQKNVAAGVGGGVGGVTYARGAITTHSVVHGLARGAEDITGVPTPKSVTRTMLAAGHSASAVKGGVLGGAAYGATRGVQVLQNRRSSHTGKDKK